MCNDLIDEHELPFSEEEFFRAFCLAVPEEEAREIARHIAWLVHNAAHKNALVEEARRQGSTNPAEIQRTTWVVDSLYFAFLTLLSDDLRERVNRFMRNRWDSERPNLTRAALHRAGMSVLAQPTPAITAQVEAQIATYEADWRRVCEEAQRRTAEWTLKQDCRSST